MIAKMLNNKILFDVKDILNSISGVEFDEAYANRVEGDVEDLKINFISISEFIRNKEASGRKKDLGDKASLRKKKH